MTYRYYSRCLVLRYDELSSRTTPTFYKKDRKLGNRKLGISTITSPITSHQFTHQFSRPDTPSAVPGVQPLDAVALRSRSTLDVRRPVEGSRPAPAPSNS